MRFRGAWLKVASTSVVLVLVFLIAGYGYYRYRFPYGWSHCCDLLLYQALEEYAAAHGGQFPAGQSSPEASLSLLYSNVDWVTPNLLRGKTVPERVVRQILSRGQLLGPDSCGWHYVQGLRSKDDPRLAIFWDKAGLGHNGQRLSRGGHVVMLLDEDREYVAAADWDDFVRKQRRLLSERGNGTEPVITAKTRIDGQEVEVQLRATDGYLYGRVWRDGRMSSGESLANIDREPETGLVGLPIVTTAELRAATVQVEPQTGKIRFTMQKHQIVFD